MKSHASGSITLHIGSVSQTIVILALTLIVPFLIHVIPLTGPVPAGARLLTMFYSPLAGVLLFRWRVGFIAGVIAPVINHWITGMPVWEMVWLLSLELGLFTTWVWILARDKRVIWVSGPLAYVLTKCVSAPMIGLFQDSTSWAFWSGSILNALPGLVLLALLTVILIRYVQSRT